MVPRSVVMGLDPFERRVSYFAGALAMVLAGLFMPHLLHNTWVTDTAKPGAKNSCVAPFKLVGRVCQHVHLTHPSDWLPQFLEIFIIGLVIILFAYLKKRVGVSFAGLFLGLAIGTTGLPFLFLGGWLVIRALRLQRYGDATFMGSSRLARAAADERRAARKAGTPVPTRRAAPAPASDAPPAPKTATPPSPSKRYTPKKRPRTR